MNKILNVILLTLITASALQADIGFGVVGPSYGYNYGPGYYGPNAPMYNDYYDNDYYYGPSVGVGVDTPVGGIGFGF